MTRFLGTMLEDLVQLALRHGSAVPATHLKASIKQHGSAKLTAVTLRMVEQASRLAAATPSPDHGVGLWFRPLIARRLMGEGIDSLGALIDVCNARGGSWWRSMRTSNFWPPRRTRSGIPLVPRRLPAACRSMWHNASSATCHCRRRRFMCGPSGSACLTRRQNIIRKTRGSPRR
jgi:Phage integrase protein